MKRLSFLISKYVLQAIIPYFVFSWLLLSVIVFVQQAGRFSDIFFSANVPVNLIWQLSIALIPNVISFTCPMAVLVGTMIGLSKMQGDSELVAIRAAGVGNIQIAVPIVLLGVLLSLFAFAVNLYGVPIAASLVRRVALQTAIQKLDSPIEPGIFNTEIAGYTIYVRHGDPETGRWRDVFIFDENGQTGLIRLITAPEGRIDVTGEASELVLADASVSTLPAVAGGGQYISENVGELRLAVRTRRGELIERLRSLQTSPDELGLTELSSYASERGGPDGIEARLMWQRRITLSLTPLVFCLLGTAMILRFNRGGRGIGSLMALAILVVYYLLAFLGEQLARVGEISVVAAGLLPILVSAAVMLWFHLSLRLYFFEGWTDRVRDLVAFVGRTPGRLQKRNLFVDLTTGLRDLDLFTNIAKYFVLSLAFLTAVFTIFTAFELWKFAGAMDGGTGLLARYLVFLMPYMYIQLSPSAAMIAVLATYVIKSRSNEIVTWISAGQSVYRLLAPCFLAMIALGLLNWAVQEQVYPRSNQLQDELRNQIRSRGSVVEKAGRYWTVGENAIYSVSETAASDNESQVATTGDRSASDNESSLRKPKPLYAFFLSDKGYGLQQVYRGRAVWDEDRLIFSGSAERISFADGRVTAEKIVGGELPEPVDPLAGAMRKPSHMTSVELSRVSAGSGSDTERQMYSVALEKRRTTPFVPLVIAIFTAPFSLSLSRKGKAATVGYAVGLWLLFTGVSSVFEQFGLSGSVSPAIAVWSPLVLFAAVGIYLLTRVRT